jgi:hypothetical protein
LLIFFRAETCLWIVTHTDKPCCWHKGQTTLYPRAQSAHLSVFACVFVLKPTHVFLCVYELRDTGLL